MWPLALLGSDAAGPRLLSLILAAAVPVLLFGGWVAYNLAEQDRTAARRAVSDTVEHVAERVASDIATKLEVAQALAASTALDSPNLFDFYTEAQRVRESQPLWHTIELANPAGVQVLNLLRPPDVPLGPTADRESFDRVIQTKLPAVGGIGPVGSVSGRQLVALRVPVIRGGTLRYVLSVALAPEGVSSILRDAGAPEGWIGAVVDARGRFIARTIGEEVEQGRPASMAVREAMARAPSGTYRGSTLEGIEVDTVYRTLPRAANWSVHFGISSERLHGPIRRSVYLIVAGGLASLALAAILGWMTARDIARRRRVETERSAAALKVSEDRGALAVEAASLGTWHWDVQGGEVVGSPRCWALLGLPVPPPAAVWRPRAILRTIHPEDRRAVWKAVERCLGDDAPIDVEFRFLWQDGSIHWVRATGQARQIGDAQVAFVHGVLADVEPRKRARAERLRLLRRLAQAQEDERRRIARELHDQVGQTVTGLSLGLKSLERTLEGKSCLGEVRQQLHWLQALTIGIGHDIHQAASDLRPAALDDLGLHKALIAYASAWRDRSGVAIDIQVIGDDDRLSTEIETAVYRVVQEALTNVLKHAGAQHVSLVIERRPDQLRIIIEDDGRGFDPEAQQAERNSCKGHGLGLSGMRERLTLVGGTLALESTVGAGAALFIQIPIEPGHQGLES